MPHIDESDRDTNAGSAQAAEGLIEFVVRRKSGLALRAKNSYTKGVSGTFTMTNYLRQQSVGEILRNAFAIYRRGFSAIFLGFFLPFFPFLLWQTEAQVAGATGLTLLAMFCGSVVSLFSWGALTVSVSDICLGNKPSVARSYRKVFGDVAGRLVSVSLLQMVLIGVGLVCLIVPGVIAALWLIFCPSIVVLEGMGSVDSLKRSSGLAKGYNWRNLGVLLLLSVMFAVAILIPAVLFVFIDPGGFLPRLSLVAIQVLFWPVMQIAVVLLYYDLRVRKEAYDATALMEDLRR
jgi:hypothetical protein